MKPERLSPVDGPDDIQKSDSSSEMWDLTAGMCADIAAVGRAHHIPVLFMLIPALFGVDRGLPAQLQSGYGLDTTKIDQHQPARLMLRAMLAPGLSTVAVEPSFDSAAATGAQFYGHVDHHLSPAGHRLLERIVEPYAPAALTGAGTQEAR